MITMDALLHIFIESSRREAKPIVPQQTTVTPRQRPRGLAAMAAVTPETSLLPPPKSPSARTRSPHGEREATTSEVSSQKPRSVSRTIRLFT